MEKKEKNDQFTHTLKIKNGKPFKAEELGAWIGQSWSRVWEGTWKNWAKPRKNFAHRTLRPISILFTKSLNRGEFAIWVFCEDDARNESSLKKITDYIMDFRKCISGLRLSVNRVKQAIEFARAGSRPTHFIFSFDAKGKVVDVTMGSIEQWVLTRKEAQETWDRMQSKLPQDICAKAQHFLTTRGLEEDFDPEHARGEMTEEDPD